MRQYNELEKYSVLEINDVMDSLRKEYDIVRLVDPEECRVLEVEQDGTVHYEGTCFHIWGRKGRCANCTSYRSCKAELCTDKNEFLGNDKEAIHSIPIYLERRSGEMGVHVIECVNYENTVQEGEAPEAAVAQELDVLTRLYTEERLLREVRQRLEANPGTRYLMLLGNIRHFRIVNQLFGMTGGNRLLVGMADLLHEHCSGEEVYGRYKDDRFVLLIRKDKFDEKSMEAYLDEVAGMLDSPLFSIQLKLGVYEIPDDNMPVVSMIERAELAEASIHDERQCRISWYQPEMMTQKLKDQRVLKDYANAIDGDEFQLYLQPQVRSDGRIVGGEALVRWVRPNGEVLSPAEFLDVLRKSELLYNLDLHIWEKAIRLLKKWQGTLFQDLYISVNLDPSDPFFVDVPEQLAQMCRKHGVPTEMLRVEITETALVEDAEQQSKLVERLHEKGFLVEIDDFGKGTSSLSFLKDIHADVLKLDMGFLRGERNRNRSRVIVDSVIDMAGSLHMGVITEGVETAEQVKSLKDMGCRYFQGYYFSKPVPVRVFEALYKENIG